MSRLEPTPTDRAALKRAARRERTAKQHWADRLADLEQAIKQASANGASLRAIAEIIDRSHGHVRDLRRR